MGVLKLKAGDDLPITFTIVDSDGDAINLTGGTIAFKIASSISVSNASAEFFGEFTSFTDPTNGISTNTIPDSTSKDWTPGPYVYQSRFIDSSGVVQSEDVDQCEILENLIDDE